MIKDLKLRNLYPNEKMQRSRCLFSFFFLLQKVICLSAEKLRKLQKSRIIDTKMYVISHTYEKEAFIKRTTIFVDADLINRIKEISKEENRGMAEIIREAMLGYIRQKMHKKKKMSFIGIGDSSRQDIAERHEELLWEEPTNRSCYL